MENQKIILKIINYIDSILKYTNDVDYTEAVIKNNRLVSFL